VEPYLHSPSTPSWRRAQLKHRDIFYFYLLSMRAACPVRHILPNFDHRNNINGEVYRYEAPYVFFSENVKMTVLRSFLKTVELLDFGTDFEVPTLGRGGSR